MCGRFALPTPEELASHFNLKKTPGLEPRYNIAPSQDIAAVRLISGTPDRELAMLKWGLIPFWAKDKKIGYKGLGKCQNTITHPVFRPSLAVPQSQNPRRSTATPAVLLNRRNQI
ncbi:MAG: SOS response-associated peptidase [Proteobacteria bacterium]|nr:SOS response-associated peptidase [Pseudomonadota bacterium]MBU4295152.1 SOS response-associated peptidase [Pseudomonadota bacterium]